MKEPQLAQISCHDT